MAFLFDKLVLSTNVISATDDRMWSLEAGPKPYEYYSEAYGCKLRMMIGCSMDGLSDPQFLQMFLTRTGKYIVPAGLHDAFYRGCVEEWNPDTQAWFAPNLRKDDWDLILREALISVGCPEAEAQVIYEAVSRFGGSAAQNDLALPIPKL